MLRFDEGGVSEPRYPRILVQIPPMMNGGDLYELGKDPGPLEY